MKNSFLIGLSLGTVASVLLIESGAGKTMKRAINRRINRTF